MRRYGIISEKNCREIVLLRGRGCKYSSCLFCDYHTDGGGDDAENFKINKTALSQIDGRYKKLEVINSGSFTDLDELTIAEIARICEKKEINVLHVESHWLDRSLAAEQKERFREKGITMKFKIGAETFDEVFRREKLGKIIGAPPEKIAEFFDECCLLFGVEGQTETSMQRDIETGLTHFERLCINIMQSNTSKISPDKEVVQLFTDKLYPKYKDNQRIDILLENTGFGVGAE